MRTARVVLLFGVVLWQASCGEPDIPTNRIPPEGGIDYSDGGGFVVQDDGGSAPGPCPDSIPKVGETCGPGTDESTSCEFSQGQCRASNGMYYNETAIYCCPNGVWEACGGASPCDMYVDAAEPEPEDAGTLPPRADAAVDAQDGGIDTSGDGTASTD
jgi:hypothetical protein